MCSAASNPSFYMVPTTNDGSELILLWIAGYMFVFTASMYIYIYIYIYIYSYVTEFANPPYWHTVLLLSITILDF